MNGFEEIRQLTEDLSLVCVSRDGKIRDIFNDLLSGLFMKAVIADDPGSGLAAVRESAADLVIIDYELCRADGADMLRELRKTDSTIPIILIVSVNDAPFIVDAINTGVTQFLAKPIQTDRLFIALESALQRVIAERRKLKEIELTIVKQKERRRLTEERFSFDRQLSIIKNDMYYRKIETETRDGRMTEWLLNVRYRAKDVLSGDCYSIRTLDNGSVLIFLIDAMGKGFSASFTTHHATTFANYLFDKEKMKSSFDFSAFVGEFQQFIRRDLHENESLSVSFVFADMKKETIDFALFSMPPLYLHTTSDTLLKKYGCNMPIMRCTNEVDMQQVALRDCKKILICSDGLVDPGYEDHLDTDFIASSFIHMLYNRFSEKTGEMQDDLTMILLRKLEGETRWEKTFTINALFSEVNQSIPEVESILNEAGYSFDFVMEIVNAFMEIIMNAYEHGSLGIGSVLKNKLAKSGEYETYLMEKEKETHTRITVTLKALVENDNEFLVVKVYDGGRGFDTAILRDTIRNPEFVDGRGLKMVRSLVDEIYYNSVGNEVLLIKVV